jgi:hypothetical protein
MNALTTTSGRASSRRSVRGRLMATLFVAQVCRSTGHSILNAVGGVLILGPLAVSLLRRPALASLRDEG